MRWRLLLAVILGLSVWNDHFLWPRASFAEGPPPDRGPGRPVDDDPGPYDPGLFDTAGFVRFQLIQGRLVLDPPRHRQGSQSREEPAIYESITVTARRGLPSLHYICNTESQQLTLAVQDASMVRIESLIRSTGERALLIQPAFGPIVWQTSRGELSSETKATTLLHLRNADPIGFQQHVEPLVKRILRGRCLERLVSDTHQRMLDQAGLQSKLSDSTTQRALSRSDIEAWVQELSSASKHKRMEAERELLSWGSVALPLIHSLNNADWDAEQRARVNRVVKRLRPRVDDTAASLAMLLVNDYSYWLQVARFIEPSQLVSVNSHLTNVGFNQIAADDSIDRIARIPE